MDASGGENFAIAACLVTRLWSNYLYLLPSKHHSLVYEHARYAQFAKASFRNQCCVIGSLKVTKYRHPALDELLWEQNSTL